MRNEVDRLHEQLKVANERARTAESEVAEARFVLQDSLDSRQVNGVRPTSSTIAERRKVSWADISKPVSYALVRMFGLTKLRS